MTPPPPPSSPNSWGLFALMFRLFVFPCIPSPLFSVFFSFGIGNLFPFGVMTISLQVCVWVRVCACASAERKQLKARGWRGFKFCLPKTAVFKARDAWQDNCFLLKGQTQRTQLEFLIVTFFFRRGGKYKRPMNTDSHLTAEADSLFHCPFLRYITKDFGVVAGATSVRHYVFPPALWTPQARGWLTGVCGLQCRLERGRKKRKHSWRKYIMDTLLFTPYFFYVPRCSHH